MKRTVPALSETASGAYQRTSGEWWEGGGEAICIRVRVRVRVKVERQFVLGLRLGLGLRWRGNLH